MSMPALRQELDLMPGPTASDGQPTWTLHDPVQNRFFNVDWITCEILRHWSLGDPDAIVAAIDAKTTLDPQAEDIERIARFLGENQLLVPNGPGTARDLAGRLAKRRQGTLKWLLHHYLFFRVPLLRPDAWLDRTLPLASLFWTRTFAVLTLTALAFAILQIVRQWQHFVATLVDLFTWQGLVAYGLALFAVKLLHELGHAFTAKLYGCRVPTMGLAFLVMWPMAYTDTNESWRLANRCQRLHLATAGILVELTVAAWAAFAWALLPDGALRSAMFVLATTSWIATLAINASPFMRFDGYFILSDWLDFPNLHERSFALARWRLREWLFDLGQEKPEHFSPARERALVLFAFVTWAYRLALYLGIAALVYHVFIKALGLFLFAVEMTWFVALPISKEISAWTGLWPKIRARRRVWFSLFALMFPLVLAFLPWPGMVGSSGFLRPAERWGLYAAGPGFLAEFDLYEGKALRERDLLFQLTSPELDARHEAARAKVERLRWLSEAAGLDVGTRDRLQISREELAMAEAESASIDEELARYAPRAPFAGEIYDIAPDLKQGDWVGRNERLATLASPVQQVVETYLDDAAIKRISIGSRASFRLDSASGPVIALTVRSIDADATRVLTNPALAASAGGSVLTRDRNGQRIAESSVYRVVLVADASSSELSHRSWRGRVSIRADWEAPAWHYLRTAAAVIIREFGF